MIPISLSFLFFPIHTPEKIAASEVSRTIITVSSSTNSDNASTVYQSLHLSEKGLSEAAFRNAYKGFIKLQSAGSIKKNILAVCDFSKASSEKRLFILDLDKEELLLSTYVAHGKNSGNEYANRFSNKDESLQSSLGFYTTASTYIGAHGLSLKLNGLEKGINDHAAQRNIVVHGANYIGGGLTGRSFGCPAVPAAESKHIIEMLKNGACLFIYHPTTNYLTHSTILND